MTTIIVVPVLVVAFYIPICYGRGYRSYGTLKNKALKQVLNLTITSTDGECCRACNLDESCVAANYERSTGRCELSDQHPMMEGAVIQTTSFPSKDILFLTTGCRAPWSAFRGHCYLYNPIKLRWSDAKDYCVSVGGHLADIHDDAENEYVGQFVNYRMWIGMTDLWNGQWRHWVTGAPVHYTSFHPEQPDNNDGENCVEMWESTFWNDCKCSRSHRSMCKKPCYIQ